MFIYWKASNPIKCETMQTNGIFLYNGYTVLRKMTWSIKTRK